MHQLICLNIELNNILRLLSTLSKNVIVTPNCNITDKLKNTVDKLEKIIKSEKINPDKVKKIQFQIVQMTDSHTCLYLRSQSCYNDAREYLPPSKHYQELFWHH